MYKAEVEKVESTEPAERDKLKGMGWEWSLVAAMVTERYPDWLEQASDPDKSRYGKRFRLLIGRQNEFTQVQLDGTGSCILWNDPKRDNKPVSSILASDEGRRITVGSVAVGPDKYDATSRSLADTWLLALRQGVKPTSVVVSPRNALELFKKEFIAPADFVSAQESEDLINLKSKAFAQQLVIGFQNVAEGARRVLDAFSGKKGHGDLSFDKELEREAKRLQDSFPPGSTIPIEIDFGAQTWLMGVKSEEGVVFSR